MVGSPTGPNNQYHSVFIFSPCHMHYHIIGFADYKLLRQDGSTAAAGHKQAFCLEDIYKYANDNKSSGYACASQGITSGWADSYYNQLSGQWIDITGVPAGDYIVHVEINAAHTSRRELIPTRMWLKRRFMCRIHATRSRSITRR